MRKSWAAIFGLAVLMFAGAFALWPAFSAPKPEDDQSALMMKKLTSAQDMLAGLVLEDFERVKKGSQELILISQEAQWKKHNSPRYNQLSSEFRWNAEKVAQMSEAKNLEGATLNYVQVVMSCVECHKLVRGGEKTAGLESLGRAAERLTKAAN